MQLYSRLFASLICICVATPSFAGTKALGFELGVSKLVDVNRILTNQTKVIDNGINNYSRGRMLKTNGKGYSIEGLKSVVYIFDNQEKLSGIIMNMEKYKFDDVYDAVSKKYNLVSEQRPFVGDQYAKFKTKDATIEIDAPHLSFEMDVRYLRDDLLNAYTKISQINNKAKKEKESRQF